MKLQTKFNLKRYYIYARRNKSEKWMDWMQTDDLVRANWHVLNIRNRGFFAKLVDKETNEVLVVDE